jgi:2-dehydro-3-deoxyphosphogluconate aldolase/(4S)-4-hydroxy-2-oxoglutarate aldolase
MPRLRSEITAELERRGIVAVIRLKEVAALRPVVAALGAGGITAFEVTMTVPRAIELIAEIAPALPSGFLLGAGTVLDSTTARRAIEAGAQFVVSPVLRPSIIEECHRSDIAAIPGCFTPTEILDAVEAGADIVKVFPATSLGPGFFKDIRGPLPRVKLVPTGGVTLDNAGDWIRAGAVAVGVGSALVDAEAVGRQQFGVITKNASRIVANVAAARRAVAG